MRDRAFKKILPYGLTALLAALLTLACWGLTLIFHFEEAPVTVMSDQAVSVLSQALLRPINAELRGEDGLDFVPTQDDAQLFIREIDDEARSLCLVTREPLPPYTVCTLYVPAEDGSGAVQSLVAALPYGSDHVIFTLPELRPYSFFRLDIDVPYTIRDVQISSEPPQSQDYSYAALAAQGRIRTPWGQLLTGFALLFACGLMLLPRKKREAAAV